MSVYKNSDLPAPKVRTLAEINGKIHPSRVTGNGHHVIGRQYPSGDVELTSLQLSHEDSLKRGGGARRENSDRGSMDSSVLEKSKKRAATQVRRKCLTFQADRLLTLTFRENVTDIDEAWRVFDYFRKLMKWRYRDHFKYVVAPEFQKRGAVHFHLAVQGYYHANTVRRLWHRAAASHGGNIDITSPRRIKLNNWTPAAIAGYLTKYIRKDETTEFNRRRYSSGGNIQIPAPIYGWVPYCDFILNILCETLGRMTRRPLRVVFEGEGRLPLAYIST